MQGILLNSLQLQALPCQNNLNFIENLIFVGIIAQLSVNPGHITLICLGLLVSNCIHWSNLQMYKVDILI